MDARGINPWLYSHPAPESESPIFVRTVSSASGKLILDIQIADRSRIKVRDDVCRSAYLLQITDFSVFQFTRGRRPELHSTGQTTTSLK